MKVMSMTLTNNNTIYIGPIYFADGRPVPELLTEIEVIKFLRLDINGPTDPAKTLKYYRDKGQLRATRIGQKYCYQKKELLRFLDKATDWTNRNSA